MKKVALITGVTGQDGAYLAEFLLEKGYDTRKIEFDSTKPDGAPRKLLQSERLRNLGWTPKVSLLHGLQATYRNFLSENDQHVSIGRNS